MATTTNFGWDTPDDTDLVKDGAAAIRTALNGVDTSFVDLKGGTTGQVLAKNSDTDLDYIWSDANPGDITGVTAGVGISGGGTSGDVTVTNSMATAITTSGDLIQGTGSGTFARLATGTAGQYLTTNGSTNSWVTPSGGMTLLSTTTLSGTSTTISSISQDFIDLVIIIKEANNNSNANFRLQLNTDTGGNYYSGISGVKGSTAILDTSDGYTGVFVAQAPANTATVVNKLFGKIYIARYTDTDITFGTTSCQYRTTTAVATTNGCFIYDNTAAIDSITLYPQSGSWTSGTAYIYGVK